jgi:hypothetical protein
MTVLLLHTLGAALVLATLWSALQFEGTPPECPDADSSGGSADSSGGHAASASQLPRRSSSPISASTRATIRAAPIAVLQPTRLGT